MNSNFPSHCIKPSPHSITFLFHPSLSPSPSPKTIIPCFYQFYFKKMSQPIDAYPNPEMTDQASPSQSNGSFGPVFAVLAVIVVISAVACVLGRLCSKRSHHTKKKKNKKEEHSHPPKASKQSQGLPKEWESKQKPNFDIELGFDKRMPPKNGGGGKPKQQAPQPYNQNGGGKPKQPHHQNGGHNKPVDIRFSNNV